MRLGKSKSKIPEVNLVPMMDVLMTVLTFFVILSMTLTGPQVSDVDLPEGVNLGTTAIKPKPKIQPFILGINAKGQLIQNNTVIGSSELVKAIQTYFQKQPNGKILVMADRSLSYRKVTQILKGLRRLGGNKVSLAVKPFKAES